MIIKVKYIVLCIKYHVANVIIFACIIVIMNTSCFKKTYEVKKKMAWVRIHVPIEILVVIFIKFKR